MRSPAISVVMPVGDGTHLADAIKGLLAQSFEDFELIIVDDTKDDSARSALRDAEQDNRVRIVSPDGAKGVAALLNHGCALALAPLIARADADDLYHKDRLSRQAAAMAAHPNLVALSCGYHRIAADGKRLWSHRPETDPAILRLFALFGAPLLHPGAVIRKEALQSVNGYDETLWTAQDSDLWVRLSKIGDLGNLPEPLVEWREHDQSVLAKRGASGKDVSLGVARKHLAAYLNSEPEGLIQAICLWRREDLSDAEIGEAHDCFGQILRQVEHREPSHVVRAFRKKIAAALWAQSKTSGFLQPTHLASLLKLSASWKWGHPA